jgi:hypothetical protein
MIVSAALKLPGKYFVIDGEVVVLDREGTRSEMLQAIYAVQEGNPFAN